MSKETGIWGLTRRGRGVLLVAALLYGMVFIVDSRAVWSITAIASFLTVFLIASRITFEFKVRAASSLIVERLFSHPAVEGKPLRVTLRLVNRSVIPLESCEILDSYPETFRLINGSNSTVILVPAKGVAELSYTVKPVLGKHCFPRPILRIRDPAGLFSEDIELNTTGCISVQPLYEPLKKKSLLPGAVYMPGGRSLARKRGIGSQFIETREYVPGDDYRLIEWKATSRTGKLMVKEFEQESSLEVILVLDTRPSMAYGIVGLTKFEYMIRGAAAIADYLVRRGDTVGLAFWSGDKRVLVRPGRGVSHAKLLVRSLSTIEWPNHTNMSRFPDLIASAFTGLGRRGRRLYIVFSDLEVSEEEFRRLVDILIRIRSLQNDVVVVSPFTPYFEAKGLEGLQGLVYKLYASKSVRDREKLVKNLMRHGITVVTVGPDDFVSKTLLRIEALRRGLTGVA
jgi:uncharacterized protein (DUF58 family)